MKDKILYQRRTDGDYKGYTEDSFYFNSTEQLWCWKQTSTEKIFKAKTIDELRQIKENNFLGKGNYEHKNDASLEKGHTSTEQFAKLTNIGSKEYVSMLLKRANFKVMTFCLIRVSISLNITMKVIITLLFKQWYIF